MIGDIGPDRFGGRDVAIGAVEVAFLPLGDAAAVERVRKLGLDRERLVNPAIAASVSPSLR